LSIAAKIILAFGALLVASCATVGDKAETRLIGRWHSSDRFGNTAEYEFREDGTFRGWARSDSGSLMSDYTGKWWLRDNAILYEYTSDKTGRIRPGTKDSDKLLKIDRGYFVIEAADGSVRKYVRAKRS
jgi:hypothetical protein